MDVPPRARVRELAANDAATESIFSTRALKGRRLNQRLISSEKVKAKSGLSPLSETSVVQAVTIALLKNSSKGFSSPRFSTSRWNARPSSRTKTGGMAEMAENISRFSIG